ncbi:MAG: Hsp20/alpha crystallin family protein [Stygiobacter sp.]|jgi:HSP20 family protein|uniref:Hsp20/alpha crystallin family protein n=1 Tax=Stygiobacter electus TaxID=3032292 RepID=A0AAE3NXU6_9BACT|nr:Hsp20/alpha crystallin family protein [Stygiobacter electus]MDF1610595.1 Hsp20/alpha crystallin family protein [Stygiobacter electus]
MTEVKDALEVKQKRTWDEALEKESWVAPLIDIYETDDDFFLNAYMPGVKKEDVKIKLEDGNLVIMGRIDYEETINKKYVLQETVLGNYYRRFKISDSIDETKIDAKLENGILNVKLPKHERVKPRTIEIK